jgi:outer membrane protein assembly factor BamA
MLRRVAAPLVLAVTACAIPAVTFAQDSRTATLEKLRAEKAAAVQPYRPGKIEKALLFIERVDPLRKIAPHNGFFVEYGYSGKPVGSGMGASIGYRHDLFDRRARLDVEAGATLRRYRMVRADFSLPSLAAGRFELGVEGIDHHNPQEDFYGLGAASLDSDRTSFLFDLRTVEGRAVVKPGGGLRVGVRYGRANSAVGGGSDARFPSIEELFDDATAAGLARQPDFSYHDLFATLDRRDQPGNPRAGGYVGVKWRHYSDLDFDRYSFRVLDADLQHFFPIFDKKRVFALRGRMIATTAGADQLVPFYFQPTLGGSDSLRSVRDYRFRDKNVLVLNAEYRWEAFSGLDMALFTDFGKVASRTEDLNLRSLERAYGIGFRFNTYQSVFLRVDVAVAGLDTPRLFIKFSKAF